MREPCAEPEREQNQRIVSEFLNAAETGQFDQLLNLLADGAALAPAPPDLSQPAPALIYDRETMFQTLGKSLAQLRQRSDHFVLFSIGQDFACVGRSGRTAKGAILIRVRRQQIAGVRLVNCPALLRRFQTLMTIGLGGDEQPGSTNERN